MPTQNQEQVAKELTIAMLSKFTTANDPVKAAEAVGKCYSIILKSVVDAYHSNKLTN